MFKAVTAGSLKYLDPLQVASDRNSAQTSHDKGQLLAHVPGTAEEYGMQVLLDLGVLQNCWDSVSLSISPTFP